MKFAPTAQADSQAAPLSGHRADAERVPEVDQRILRFFLGYARWYVRRHFHRVLIGGYELQALPADRPLVVYLNHPSWWDPMIGLLLVRAMPERRHFCPIEAAMLEKYGIFKKLGFFPVEPETARGGLQFLRRAQAILAADDAALWVTAQGRFADVRERPVELRPGLAHLARRLPRATVVPIALEYAFWTESAPECLIRVGEPLLLGEAEPLRDGDQAWGHPVPRPGELDADAWQTRLSAHLERTMDELAEHVIARDPAAFRSLIEPGRKGIGGVYDVWRWLKAKLRGEKFERGHQEG